MQSRVNVNGAEITKKREKNKQGIQIN